MLAALGDDLDEAWLRERLAREGALEALDALRALAATGQLITESVLEQVQDNLRAGQPWDAKRADRVRKVNERTVLAGMARPARMPGKRAALMRMGGLGPFAEGQAPRPTERPARRK